MWGYARERAERTLRHKYIVLVFFVFAHSRLYASCIRLNANVEGACWAQYGGGLTGDANVYPGDGGSTRGVGAHGGLIARQLFFAIPTIRYSSGLSYSHGNRRHVCNRIVTRETTVR